MEGSVNLESTDKIDNGQTQAVISKPDYTGDMPTHTSFDDMGVKLVWPNVQLGDFIVPVDMTYKGKKIKDGSTINEYHIKSQPDDETGIVYLVALSEDFRKNQKESGRRTSRKKGTDVLLEEMNRSDQSESQLHKDQHMGALSNHCQVGSENPSLPSKMKYKHKLTERQLAAVRQVRENDKMLHTLLGPAGATKTFIAMAAALDLYNVNTDKYKNGIIYTRPNRTIGKQPPAMPGGILGKWGAVFRPAFSKFREFLEEQPEVYKTFLANLQESSESELPELSGYIHNLKIEFIPTEFLTGDSIPNSILIFDEAQQTTDEEMWTGLTRLEGNDIKLIVCGDNTGDQCSLKGSQRYGCDNNGLTYLEKLVSTEVMGEISTNFDFNQREDILRSQLTQKLVQAREEIRNKN